MKKQYFLFCLFFINCHFLSAQSPFFEPIQFKIFSEFTTTTKDIAFRWGDKGKSVGIGYGAGVDLRYRVNNRFYLQIGGNIIQRRFKTIVFLNQWALFPEGTALPSILITLNNFSYQIIEGNVGAGFSILKNEKIDLSVFGKIGAYGVVSANYPADFRDWGGLNVKGDIFGKMSIVGSEAKFPLFNNYFGILGIEYSLKNKIGRDSFLDSQDEEQIRVPHKFYRLNIGLQKRF